MDPLWLIPICMGFVSMCGCYYRMYTSKKEIRERNYGNSYVDFDHVSTV